jgi:hypothetical protein
MSIFEYLETRGKLSQIDRIAQETLMKLVLDPEEYPDIEETLLEIKKTGLQDETYDTFLHVIDGTWTLSTNAFWHWNQSSLDLSHDPWLEQRTEKYAQWFCHSRAIFREDLKTSLSAFRRHFHNQSFEFIKGFSCAVILNAPIKSILDSPSLDEISREKLQEIADLIEHMTLSYPEYPVWAESLPIAMLGDSIVGLHKEAGSVFCPINEEWALELSITAWLDYRKPTTQEIQLIEKALPYKTRALYLRHSKYQ